MRAVGGASSGRARLTAVHGDAPPGPDPRGRDDENQPPEYALGDWFAYAEENHTLTPLDQVYVVKAVSGSYYKVQIVDYYDDAGTPTYITFRGVTRERSRDEEVYRS